MPVLSNARHERYAQELAKGQSADAAYQAAGYKPDRGNASRLTTNDSVSQRVAELQAEMAAQTVENVAVTRTSVLAELAKIGFVAIKDENVRPSDKRGALQNIAQIEGWVVSKHELTGANGGPIKHDLSGLSDEQLAQLETIFGAIAGVDLDRGRSGGDTAKGGPA